jgi:hypothetical protein
MVHRRVQSFTHSFLIKMDPKRVRSICTTEWYAKLCSTTYYTRPDPYRLMVVLYSWVVAPQTGP